MLLCVYFLPYLIIVIIITAPFKGAPPPKPLTFVLLTAYSLSSPVLQSFVLVHVRSSNHPPPLFVNRRSIPASASRN